MWFVIALVVILLFVKLDDILDALKSKSPDNLKQEKIEAQEQQALLEALKDQQGKVCTLRSKDFIYIHSNVLLKAKILEVDQDWISLEYQKKYKKSGTYQQMVFKTSSIESFSSQV
jgi:hypothetical protein